MKKLTIAFFGSLAGVLMMRSIWYAPSLTGLSQIHFFAVIVCLAIAVSTQPQQNPWQYAGFFLKKTLIAITLGCSGYTACHEFYDNFRIGFPHNSLEVVLVCATATTLLSILFLRIRPPYGYESIRGSDWYEDWIHLTFSTPNR